MQVRRAEISLIMNEWRWAAFGFGILASIHLASTPAMRVAGIAYALMATGVWMRKKSKRAHAALMSSAISLDLMLVLILAVKRNAVATALEFSLGPWQQAHIAASTVALLLYFPIVALAVARLRNPNGAPELKAWHARIGILAFVFRTIGFLLMFSMGGLHPN